MCNSALASALSKYLPMMALGEAQTPQPDIAGVGAAAWAVGSSAPLSAPCGCLVDSRGLHLDAPEYA